MTGVRPLRESDIEAVADLYERVERTGEASAAAGLGAYFRRTLLEHPWVDAELPSLVHEDHAGRLAGFIGSHVRVAVLDGRRLRIAYCGQLVTDPAARAAAPGFFLLRAYLLGAQDVTITDSAGAETRRMWRTLGGSAAYLPSLTWLRPLRAKAPVSLVLDLARSRRARGRRGRSEPKPSAAAFRGDASGDLAALTSGRLREAFDAVVRHYRFHVVHDERTFDWLLAGLASVPQRGRLAGAIVVDRDRPVGWFLYLVAPTGIADVLQVGAAPSDAAQVLVALRRHARSEGASLLRGRVEAHLLEPLGITKSFFRFNGSALIAGRDADALAAVQSGHALLSRTDGDWWMGHATEDFGKAR